MKKSIVIYTVLTIFIFASMMQVYSVENSSIINKDEVSYAQGTVVDLDTKQVIKNAVIKITSIENGSEQFLKLDNEGNFKVENLKLGYYTWTIDSPAYDTAVYAEYPIVPDGVTFYFELTKGKKINKNFKDRSSIEIIDQKKSDINKIKDDGINYSVPTDPIYIPRNVTVYRTDVNKTETYDFEYYIAHVISKELNPDYSIYNPLNLTSDQKLTALKTQSIAARSYAAYHIYVEPRHTGTTYKLCSDVHCQAFDPNFVINNATTATTATAGKILIDKNFQTGYWYYADTVFSASCDGNTVSAKDSPVFGTARSYLVSVSCPDDESIRVGFGGGHGVGLCQDGTVIHASKGYTYSYILSHYFTGLTQIIAEYN